MASFSSMWRESTARSRTTVSSTMASFSSMGTIPDTTICPSCSASMRRISSSSSMRVGTTLLLGAPLVELLLLLFALFALVGLLPPGLLGLFVIMLLGLVPPAWTDAAVGALLGFMLPLPLKLMWSPRSGINVWMVSSRPIALATTKHRRMASTLVSTWVLCRNWWRNRSSGDSVAIVLVGSWGRERAIVNDGVGNGVDDGLASSGDDKVVVSFGVKVG